jgi:glutathione S-transferase
LATLAEKGQEAELVTVDLGKGEHKQPAHLARHPFGVVPVLEDEGFWLYESRAIIQYLDRRLPGPALVSTDLREYARMEQWISAEQSYFSPPAMAMVKQLYFGKLRGTPPDLAAVDAARPKVEQALDVANRGLEGQPYLAGGRFSLAEISWMPYLEYLIAGGVGELIASRANVARWWEQISARPSWRKVTGKTAT